MSWKPLTSLRRVTSDGRYLPEIDGLRFVAIGSVLLYHITLLLHIARPAEATLFQHRSGTGPFLFGVLMHGRRGVEIFFAISGFVLGLPFARYRLQAGPRVKLRAYFLRRITRLEPPYLINLLLRLPVVAVVKHFTPMQAAAHFAVSLFYADWLVYGTMPAIHPASWSLAVEVQFYVLAPLFAVAVFHSNAWVRRILSVAFLLTCSLYAAHLAAPELVGSARLSLLSFAQLFVAGMMSADFYLTVQPRLKRGYFWDVVGIPLWLAVFALPTRAEVYLLPWMMLVLIPSAFLGRLLGAFFRVPWIALIGGMCYSLYLIHSLVLEAMFTLAAHWVRGVTFWQAWTIACAVQLPLVLLMGTLFYVLIERPCMNKNWPQDLAAWFRRRSGRQASA